jgi:hypothetical protein
MTMRKSDWHFLDSQPLPFGLPQWEVRGGVQHIDAPLLWPVRRLQPRYHYHPQRPGPGVCGRSPMRAVLAITHGQ